MFNLIANVRYGGTSHFLAFNTHGAVTVIEVVGTKSAVYTGASVLEATLQNHIVRLSVEDVNHEGRPNLVIHVEDTSITPVLYNTGTGFPGQLRSASSGQVSH